MAGEDVTVETATIASNKIKNSIVLVENPYPIKQANR